MQFLKNIEHIGIAVKDMESAEALYTKLIGQASYKKEYIESEKVWTSFYQMGESKIELLEATHEESAIAKFILKKGEGIHHIAFRVDDIVMEMSRLKDLGFQLIHDEPRRGADNMWVCFVHPKSANGVLVELCQKIEE